MRIFAIHEKGKPTSVVIATARPWYDTRAEAEAVAAVFPKTYDVLPEMVVGFSEKVDDPPQWRVSARINLVGQKAKNGGISGTGVDIYHKIVRKAEAAGIVLEWDAPFRNSYATREAFETALPW